ncbi:unnamed protein product [Owenia fusiformis]|uniref:Uncharacterized protein n=1 Tax=Owenia fusiformis TaxID=6347 RepID=A0A8J1XU54_OWEFU|nr:unnamed protein product [Owenia fusiformis]
MANELSFIENDLLQELDGDRENIKEIINYYGGFDELLKKAKTGDVGAMLTLGNAYFVGTHCKKDRKESYKWYEHGIQAAEKSPAHDVLIDYYYEFATLLLVGGFKEVIGDLNEHIAVRALHLLNVAAEGGQRRAQHSLGMMFMYGDFGMGVDYNNAENWFSRASADKEENLTANQKLLRDPEADSDPLKYVCLYRLWEMYSTDRNSKRAPQHDIAVKYLKGSAEGGFPEAQRELGKLYLEGDMNVEKNTAACKLWLEKAQANDAIAKRLLNKLSFPADGTVRKMCHNESCNKLEGEGGIEKLLKCTRCRVAFYCGKECQKAHWKLHKKVCQKTGTEHSCKK